ncbi:unnamed protein product, partial [marine sediment metagenome]
MFERNTGRWVAVLIVVAVPCLLFWAGCSKDLMSADTSAPTGSRITHPEDGAALSSKITDIRGRAEVGATVEIAINGDDFDGAYSA